MCTSRSSLLINNMPAHSYRMCRSHAVLLRPPFRSPDSRAAASAKILALVAQATPALVPVLLPDLSVALTKCTEQLGALMKLPLSTGSANEPVDEPIGRVEANIHAARGRMQLLLQLSVAMLQSVPAAASRCSTSSTPPEQSSLRLCHSIIKAALLSQTAFVKAAPADSFAAVAGCALAAASEHVAGYMRRNSWAAATTQGCAVWVEEVMNSIFTLFDPPNSTAAAGQLLPRVGPVVRGYTLWLQVSVLC